MGSGLSPSFQTRRPTIKPNPGPVLKAIVMIGDEGSNLRLGACLFQFHAHAILCLNVQCVCCHCWVLLIDCAALTFSKSSIDCAVPVYQGPFKCYVTPIGVGVSNFPGEKRYEGLWFNVISITRGWVGVQFSGKKRYETLEWPLTHCMIDRSLMISVVGPARCIPFV